METSNLAEKLSEILNDPEGMEKIGALAQELLSDEEKAGIEPLTEAADGIKIAKMLGTLKNSSNDTRSQLLLALRPHLSHERRERVDKAVKLLKLAGMLPLLQESGLLSDIL